MQVDVLVIGGGAAGCAAGWQAAVGGAKTLIAEPSPWLGGMITAAGVSAFDGNKLAMGSGFFRKLRDALEDYYGGAEAVRTGWISDTCFEPNVAARLIAGWVQRSGAEVWHGAELLEVLLNERRVVGAKFRVNGEVREVRAKVVIEATEYGDVLAMAGILFSLGREAKSETGEEHAPETADLEVQDLTWVATMKKYVGTAPRVTKPAGYDARAFDCSTAEICSTPDESILNHTLHNWNSFLTYALLPNDKFLLNWPFHSNDSPDTIGVFGTAEERQRAFAAARHRTMCFVYYMQNELGHPEWGLATDEYGTADSLPYIPYIRESRRGIGTYKMVEEDVLPVGARARFFQDAIAVGDYFLDHHHSKAHLPPASRLVENYPANAPFQIPYGALVPRDHDGLLLAEKSISVSHIVNGCTRLQPCVMLTGQAAGMAAALCVEQGIEPRALNARLLQENLIDAGVAVYQTIDLHNSHPAFKAVQRLAMSGVRFDETPYSFAPGESITREEARRIALKYAEVTRESASDIESLFRDGISRGDFYIAVDKKAALAPSRT